VLQRLLVSARQKLRVTEVVGGFFAGCLEQTPTRVISENGAMAPCNWLSRALRTGVSVGG